MVLEPPFNFAGSRTGSMETIIPVHWEEMLDSVWWTNFSVNRWDCVPGRLCPCLPFGCSQKWIFMPCCFPLFINDLKMSDTNMLILYLCVMTLSFYKMYLFWITLRWTCHLDLSGTEGGQTVAWVRWGDQRYNGCCPSLLGLCFYFEWDRASQDCISIFALSNGQNSNSYSFLTC